MTSGFLKIYRKFFNHPLWKEKRSFSKAEAFLDLLQLAAFMPTKRLCAGEMVTLEVGQLVGSERYLSDRWGWSTKKVRAFLTLSQQEQMIVIKKKRQGSIITLCNYERYASEFLSEEAPKKHQRSAEEARRKRIEEVEELKNLNDPADLFVMDVPELPKPKKPRFNPMTTRIKNRSPEMDMIGSCFGKPEEIVWTTMESEMLKSLAPTLEEITLIVEFYSYDIPEANGYRNRNVKTLLQNWSAQLISAREFFKQNPELKTA